MFVFNSIKELLETLYNGRKWLDLLFTKRKTSVNYEDLLHYLDDDEQEKLQRLLDTSIVVRSGNSIELHNELLDFFEKFTDTTEEITVGYIDDLIQILEKNLDLYDQEKRAAKKDEYLLKIKRNLRTVGKTILKNVNTLRDKVEDVYATEGNYTIKKLNLDNYDEKRKRIDELLDYIETLFTKPKWEFFIKITQNDELLSILVALKKDLSMARKNLIDIAQKIIEFLNQIKQQSEIYKHLQKIKQLKDQFLLKEKTDFETVINTEKALFFQTISRNSMPLSLSLLKSDEGYEMILKVKRKSGRTIKGTVETAEAISDEYFDSAEISRPMIDHDRLKSIFLARGDNLFQFLLNYEFDIPLERNERITLFCKMASLYSDELDVTEQFESSENIEYAVIVPKSLRP